MQSAAQTELRQPPALRLLRGGRPEARGSSPAGEVFNGLRIVRTLAMLSIVGYHVSWEPLFGIAFGLTSLQVIMCTLAGRGERPRPLAAVMHKRGLRLLAPWLVWSAVYAAFEVLRSVRAGAPPFAFVEDWMWASGTSFHLWFLPFAFAAAVAVSALRRLFRQGRAAPQAIASCALGVGLLFGADPLTAALQAAMPFDLWIAGAPTIAFGLALGRALSIEGRPRRAWILLTIALMSALPYCLGTTLIAQSQLFERYAVAIPVVCLGLMIELPERRWMTALASLNLGVYLVHMLVIRLTDHLPGVTELAALPRTAVVYAACLLTVVAVRRARIPHIA